MREQTYAVKDYLLNEQMKENVRLRAEIRKWRLVTKDICDKWVSPAMHQNAISELDNNFAEKSV